MSILLKTLYGSSLYGTRTSESDTDYRGIYLSPLNDCLLNRIKDTVTDPTEEDTQLFSLQYYLALAAQGQSIAIELLAAPDSAIVATSPTWEYLRANRKRFFTRNMHSFLGYAKSMSGKYSSRIDRLNETEIILSFLRKYSTGGGWDRPYRFNDGKRLTDVWGELPESPNAVKTINERNMNEDKRIYVVCGRELQATVTIGHAYTIVKSVYDSYGERVRKAKDGNLDFKALAHAYRVAYQALEIVMTGDLIYPLCRADYLRDMRLGRFDFIKEGLDAKLDDLINEVQAKMDASDLPDKVDGAWLDNVVLEAYGRNL
jgi:hypothetical protein